MFEKESLGRPKHRRENFKMDIEEMMCEDVESVHVAQ
jgi:hypothetical protein